MLEIRGVTKTYRTKKGGETHALRGVTLAFPARGLVFLLGKSGSGKSTLLNILGGLDRPDAGELIAYGRSSAHFTEEDFDSYRNTCVGFIFQEYNLLDEFTVEENVALALELQGMKRGTDDARRALAAVEMEEFAARRPNTLSGGQKQRAAIARALVKDPPLLLADEPTGALDSETGQQVLDTLQKLSKDKLVIVVSHDREFAERYADRIVELKDGAVCSDATRTPSGFVPTRAADGAAQPADEAGAADTADAAKGADAAKAAPFIRARLPMRHAVRMGASSVRTKPVRLAFTILLSFLAFTLFGLFSTLTFYDRAETAARTYLDQGYPTLCLQNQYRYTDVYYHGAEREVNGVRSAATFFTAEDADALRAQFGDAIVACYDYSASFWPSAFAVTNAGSPPLASYYSTSFLYFAEFTGTWWESKLLTDTDLSSLGEDDVLITAYLFESLQFCGLTQDGEEVSLHTYDDIVGKQLLLAGKDGARVPLTVRGVLDIRPSAQFDALREGELPLEQRQALRDELEEQLQENLAAAVFVTEDFYAAHADALTMQQDTPDADDLFYYPLSGSLTATVGEETVEYIQEIAPLPAQIGSDPRDTLCFLDGRDDASLRAGEIVPRFDIFTEQIRGMAAESASHLAADEGAAFLKESEVHIRALRFGEIPTLSDDGELIGTRAATRAELNAALDWVLALIDAHAGTPLALDTSISLQDQSGRPLGEFEAVGFMYGNLSYAIVGAYLAEEDCTPIALAYAAENMIVPIRETAYVRPDDAIYRCLQLPAPTDAAAMRALVHASEKPADNDTFWRIVTPASDALANVDEFAELAGAIFLWLGVALAAFAVLLLFNFISASILSKRREIGILRALGARSTDVFKIFCTESAIVAGACWLLSMVACFILCALLNGMLAGEIGVSAFVFGPLSWLVMLGIALLSSAAATILPVRAIARQRPADSIRAL